LAIGTTTAFSFTYYDAKKGLDPPLTKEESENISHYRFSSEVPVYD